MSSRADDRPRRDRSRSRSRDRAHRDDRRALSRERDSGRYETRGPRVEREEGEYRSPRRSRSPARRRSASPRRSRSPSRHRRRSRSRSRSMSHDRHKSRRKDRKRSRSRSRSVSSSSSSSSDERRQKRKHKHHKRKRSRSKDREKKQRKKEKKERKKKTAAVGHQWGKYGIISEADLYHKEAEFRAWLVEEQKINPETISKDRTKKEFARFVEDFNTATLPHEKFYNIASYEARMTALRAGEYLPPQDDGYDPNADLRALQSSHKRKAKESDSFITREQLEELRKVQAERVEVGKMKLLGMDIKQSMGVRMDGTAFDD